MYSYKLLFNLTWRIMKVNPICTSLYKFFIQLYEIKIKINLKIIIMSLLFLLFAITSLALSIFIYSLGKRITLHIQGRFIVEFRTAWGHSLGLENVAQLNSVVGFNPWKNPIWGGISELKKRHSWDRILHLVGFSKLLYNIL